MPDPQHLRAASDHLAAAGDAATGGAAERLRELSAQLDRLADRERGPDHGRLARLQTAFDEVEDDLSGEALEAVRAANDEVVEYRRDVPGV
jgi:hypothetical protein